MSEATQSRHRRSMSFEIGLLYRRQYRGLLTALKWDGELDDFIEDKGWLSSQFALRGLTLQGRQHLQRLSDSIGDAEEILRRNPGKEAR